MYNFYIFLKKIDKKITNRNRLFVSEVLIGILFGGFSLLIFAAAVFLVYFAVKKAKEFEHGEASTKEGEHKAKINEANKNNNKTLNNLWKEDGKKKDEKNETPNDENISEENKNTPDDDNKSKIIPTINDQPKQNSNNNTDETIEQSTSANKNQSSQVLNISNNQEQKKITNLNDVNNAKNIQKNSFQIN